MSVPKAKALLTVCAALLLCGCGQALSEREIVRAVFFARQQGGVLRLSAAGRSERRE
mgnify:FL=1